MRTKNAIKNIVMSIGAQIVIILLGFISRKVFVDNLGVEYLGINGLLTNIISMMVLIESGIGISIVYNLYKPLAEDDKGKIVALVQLYKKAYRILAFIMLGMSCILYLFLGKLMKTDTPIQGMFLVYSLFVAKNMVSYLNAYKWALINADQKGYVLTRNNMCFQMVTTLLKIAVLRRTQSYLIFLAVELGVFVVQNIVNTVVVNKRYPYILTTSKADLDPETKENINKNVKAMFLHNIGGYLVCSTDNLLISALVSLKAVGLYSNYTMIIGQLAALVGPIVGGIGASVGNLIATEKEDKIYEVFQTTFLISFWIYSFSTIFLYNLLEPFINWWIGEGLLLDKFTFLVILINFYINGMRGVIGTFKSKAGLFVQDKYAPVIEGIFNLVISIILVKYVGLVGVFLGTTISTLAVPFWNQARIVYKYLFRRSVGKFFGQYIIYIGILLGVGGVTSYICSNWISGVGFLGLVTKGVVCVVIPNSLYSLIFYRTKEFQYLWNLIKAQMNGITIKVKLAR